MAQNSGQTVYRVNARQAQAQAQGPGQAHGQAHGQSHGQAHARVQGGDGAPPVGQDYL